MKTFKINFLFADSSHTEIVQGKSFWKALSEARKLAGNKAKGYLVITWDLVI